MTAKADVHTVGAVFDLTGRLESGLRVEGKYRVTTLEIGQGKQFARRLLFRWVPSQ